MISVEGLTLLVTLALIVTCAAPVLLVLLVVRDWKHKTLW